MLISGRGVLLPEIGALYIERQAARKLADGRLLTPRNVVLFSKQEQAPSLVDEIVAIASCSTEQAQDIYERWRAKTYQQGVLTIGGIGELKGGSFTMDKGFMGVINPQGVKTIVVRKKSSNKWLYAVVCVAVLVALGFFAYVMWGDKIMGGASEKPIQEQVVAPEQTVAEQTIVADSVAVQPQAVEQPQEVKRNEYAYYVVMGIFSTSENAERAVSQVQSKIKDIECVVLPFKGGKHMVTIFGGDSAADCNAFARSYRDIYPDLWVYNMK